MKTKFLFVSVLTAALLASCGGNAPDTSSSADSSKPAESSSKPATSSSTPKSDSSSKPASSSSKPAESSSSKPSGPTSAVDTRTWVAGEKVGVVTPETCGTEKAWRLDVKDATGWNNATTKMNGKTAPNNKSEWDISGVSGGRFAIEISAKMSYESHSNRYWFNHALNDKADDGNPPDSTTEDPFRYFFTVDGGAAINPTSTQNWGEDGLTATEQTPVTVVNTYTLDVNAKTFALNHGNIGYSLIIDYVRLVLLGDEKVPEIVPEPITMTVAEIADKKATDDTKLVEVTGVAEDFYNGSFYIADTNGNYFQAYKAHTAGVSFEYANNKFTTKVDSATKVDATAELEGKIVTVKGTLTYYNSSKMEIVDGLVTVAADQTAAKPATVISDTTENGSFTVSPTENYAFGTEVTVTPTANLGYIVSSVKVNHGYYTRTIAANEGVYKFDAWTWNKVQVTFAAATPTPSTVANAATIANALSENAVTPELYEITGYVKSISGDNKVIADTMEGTDTLTIAPTEGELETIASAHIGDQIKIVGCLKNGKINYVMTKQLVNIQSCTVLQTANYTITVDSAVENGSFSVSATTGVYGDTITITPNAAEGYHAVRVYVDGKAIAAVGGVYSFSLESFAVVSGKFLPEGQDFYEVVFDTPNEGGLGEGKDNKNSSTGTIDGLALGWVSVYRVTQNYIMINGSTSCLYSTVSLGTINSVTITLTSSVSTKVTYAIVTGSTMMSTSYASADNVPAGGTKKTGAANDVVTHNGQTGEGYFNISVTNDKNLQIKSLSVIYTAA